MTILLKGITWGHSRGFLPMVATAQRFHETHPGLRVQWEIRSLQEFADYPIADLAEAYDLPVINRPFAGTGRRNVMDLSREADERVAKTAGGPR